MQHINMHSLLDFIFVHVAESDCNAVQTNIFANAQLSCLNEFNWDIHFSKSLLPDASYYNNEPNLSMLFFFCSWLMVV